MSHDVRDAAPTLLPVSLIEQPCSKFPERCCCTQRQSCDHTRPLYLWDSVFYREINDFVKHYILLDS